MKRKTCRAVLMGLLLLTAAGSGVKAQLWTELPPGSRSPLVNMPSLAPLAERAMPAVVTVYTRKEVEGMFFFAPMPRLVEGTGSGFIISPDGYIVSNYHVVAGSEAITVEVGVQHKKKYTAVLIGADKDSDVALIKIDGRNLPVLPLGNSDELKVGDWVVAIGSPFGLSHTLTVGVVSAKGRRNVNSPYDDFIQTDASINSGNSGGPLINLAGEVVGINTMILSPSGGNVGIGLSVPINVVKMILPQIQQSGKVTRSWLGVSVKPVTEEVAAKAGLNFPRGAHVAEVVIGSPADKAGIEVDDIILSFNDREITDSSDLPILVSSFGVGKKAVLELARGRQRMKKEIWLEEKPSPDKLTRLRVRGGEGLSTDNILGVAVRDLTAEDRAELGVGNQPGVLVTAVADNSAGALADIQPGDIISSINGRTILTTGDFSEAVSRLHPGVYVRLSLRRGNATLFRVFRL